MVLRLAVATGLLGVLAAAGGCMSLNYDEDVRMINHYGKSLHDIRIMTNKYFMDYDEENPFED